jgi:hypothetical protein
VSAAAQDAGGAETSEAMEKAMEGNDENWTAVIGLYVAMLVMLACVFAVNVMHLGAG